MQPVGIARTEIEIVDLSVLINTGLKGINGVIGVTERGPVNKPVLVGSWIEFVREFGGLTDNSDFPLICRRALEAGAKLMVSRVGHYSDITDKTTLEGSKSTGVLGLNFQADSIGSWGNGISVKVTPAISGATDKHDITVDLSGYPDLSQSIRNFSKTPTQSEIDQFNLRSKYAKIVSTGTIANGNVTLTGGVQDTSDITDQDYIGDVQSETGLHAFDNVSDINKLCIPEKAVPAIDTALAKYADDRADIIALLRTPIGVDGNTAVDYREGTGIYSHQPIDTWRAFMFTGDLKVAHPETGVEKEIPAIGDIMGLMSQRDNKSKEWFSFSGSKRGRIKNALGVVHNLGSAARQTTADLVDARGINMIIEHPSFGIVSWGNSTLQKADTLLKHANVAELLNFLERGLKPLIQSELFEPNDVETWKNIHRRVVPLMEYIKNNRGIWGYLYQGDQDVDSVSEAVVNTPDNIDAGKYVFNLFIKPKVAMKYLGVKIAVSNSGVSYETLSDNL